MGFRLFVLCISGEYGRHQGSGDLPDDAGEETVMEWFMEEMAKDGGNDARKGSSEEQVRVRDLRFAVFSGAHVAEFAGATLSSAKSAKFFVPRVCAFAGVIRLGGGSGNGTSRSCW